jgi:hypothetical protein
MKVGRVAFQPTTGDTTGFYWAGNGSGFSGGALSDAYGAKRYFIAAIVLGDSTKSVSAFSINTGGVPLAAAQVATFTASGRKIEIWGLANPRVIGNISVTFSGTTDYVLFTDLLFGVDQDAVLGAFVTASGTSTAPTASVSDAEDYALAFMATVSESVTRTPGSDLTAFQAPALGGYASKTTGAANPCSLDVAEIRYCREGVATPMPWTLSSSVAWLQIVVSIHRHGRPTSAYRAWRDGIAADRTVLIEMEPGEQLSGWSLVSGSTYSIPFASLVLPTINGGLRRKLIGLEFDGAALQELASQAAVTASPGNTYFLDTATNLLYCKTSGASPDTIAAVTASFRIHLATREVDFLGGEYYEPRLVGTLPTQREEAQDLLFGITLYPGGEVELQNSDGLFDTLAATWLWRNRRVRAFLGGLSLARTDYKQQSELAIEDFQAGLKTAIAKLRAGADALQAIVPNRPAATQMGFSPNVDGAASAYEPIAIGLVVDVVPQAWRDFGGGTVDYITADSSYLPVVTGCRAINRSTGEVTTLAFGSQWLYSVSGGLHVFDAVFGVPGNYEIRCDIDGLAFGLAGVPAFGSITLAFLSSIGSIGADEIDRESFTRADLYSPTIAWRQVEQIPLAELLRRFEKSAFSQLSVSAEGFWAARFWAPCDPDFDILPEVADYNMQADPQPEAAPSTPLYEMVVRYAYRQGPDSWSSASHTSTGIVGTHRTHNTQTLETAIDNQEAATILADRYAAVQNAPTRAFRFIENGFSLIEKRIFEHFLLTMSRAPTAAGSYSRALHEITEVAKTLNPPAIEVVVGNMQGLGNYARCAAPNALAAVTYTTATADQKARFIFAADDTTGRGDPADSASYAPMRAW